MNTPASFGSIVIALLMVAPIATARDLATKALVGEYEIAITSPLKEFRSNGTTKVIGEQTQDYRLELNADSTARFFTEVKGAKPSAYNPQRSSGAWLMQGDRLFYVVKSGWFCIAGSWRVRPSRDGLEFIQGSLLGTPLGPEIAATGSVTVQRTAKPLPSDPTPSADPGLLDRLQGAIQVASDIRFQGTESEGELTERFRAAVAAKDLRQLLALTYPTNAVYVENAPLEIALKYLEDLESPGLSEVRVDESEKVRAEIARMPAQGIVFPPGIEPKGLYWLQYSIDGKDRRGRGIYFGKVEGKWAVLGDPSRRERPRLKAR